MTRGWPDFSFTTMPMHPLFGHHQARRRLALATRGEKLPQVILISGPPGVGKQRLALWLAQLLFCENASEEPCRTCRSCLLVEGLTHPDLHWIIPIPRPKASDPAKQVAEAGESIAGAVAERRADPLYGPPEGMASHGVASARLMLRRAGLTPVEAKRKVFVVGQADRLVPQEANPEAANALLKLLEEPPADTVVVLTTTDTNRMLPTVRSRAAPLRLGRLPDEEVGRFLDQMDGDRVSAADRSARIRLAGGSIGRVVQNEEEAVAKARAAGLTFVEAVLDRNTARRFERALSTTPWSARGEFTTMLDSVADMLNDAARDALGQPTHSPVPRVLKGRSAEALVAASTQVRATRETAQRNVNPQLLLASLGMLLAETL